MKIQSSVLLPQLKDRQDADEARKSALDLLRLINVASDPRFGDIPQGNYSQFEDNGFYNAQGSAVAWKDMITSADTIKTGTTAPTFAAAVNGIYAYRFDALKGEYMHGSFEIEHDYKEGTDMEFHVHWMPTTTNTGNIVWGVEYSVANIGYAFPASTTVSINPIAAPGVVNQHVLTDIATISGVDLRIGAVILYRVFRQNGGTDTFTGNAFLLSIGIHYQCDTLGSRKETAK